MSLSDELLTDGFASHVIPVHGDEFVIQSGPRAGDTFTANAEAVSFENSPHLIGEDIREMILLHCIENVLGIGNDSQTIISGLGAQWIITRVEDNESDVSTDYWARKVIQNIDV